MSVELQKQVCEIIDVIMFKKISVEVFSYWFEDSGNDIQELGSTSWHVYWWFSSHDLPILLLFSSTSAWLLRECTQEICHPRTLLPWTLQPGKYFGCIQFFFGHKKIKPESLCSLISRKKCLFIMLMKLILYTTLCFVWQVDIAYAPYIERFQIAFSGVSGVKYDITAGRPSLAKWIQVISLPPQFS